MANTITQQPTTPAPATPTTVTITQTNHAQVTVDLHDLSQENADKLFAALGRTGTNTDYQKLARDVAGFARNFKSIVSVGLPSNMTYQAAMNNFMQMLKANGGTITEGSDQYLKDLQNSALGQSIIQSGMYRTAAGAAAVAGAGQEFLGGLVAPINVVAATVSAVRETAVDVYDQIGFGMSERQAQAIGTAYAAALYSKVDAPGIQRQPNIIEKGIAYIESAASNIWQLLPASLTAYLGAAVKFMTNGYHWDAAYNEAFAEATAARSAPALTYEQTLQRNMAASADRSARPEAAAMLRQAGTIAGTATAPIADMVEHGGVFRDTAGTFRTLAFEGGKPTEAVLNTAGGQPLTMEQRRNDRVAAVMQALPNSTIGWTGAAAGGAALGAIELSAVAPLRGVWNLGVRTVALPFRLATDTVLGTISSLDQMASRLTSAVLPSSAGIRAHEMQQASTINRAGDIAARQAEKLGKKNGLTGEALEQAVREAAEAARANAEAALKPRGIVSRAFDFLRPLGDGVRHDALAAKEDITGLRNWIKGGINDMKEMFLFDRRTATRKAADAAKAEADRAVQIVLGNARTPAAATANPTPSEPSVPHATEPTAPSTPVRTEPVVPHAAPTAEATEVARGVARATEGAAHNTTVAETAETIARGARAVAQRAEGKGPWGKLIILGAAVFGAGAAGVAEAAEPAKPGENKVVNVVTAAARGGLWDTLGGMVGLPDFAQGDITRGAGALASWIPLVPGTAIVDTFRQVDSVDKVPAAQVAQLNDAFSSSQSTKTGNVYLDRVIALRAMQARGVKEVAMAPMNNFNPIWSTDNMGEVAHEGPAFTNYFALDVAAPEITARVQEAIDMNLRLFVVKGGNLAKAQEALGIQVAPVTPAPAEPAPSAPVAQTAPLPATPVKTSALTNQQLLAGHEEVIQQARMSVNRVASDATRPTALNLGSSFASVDSTRAAIATRTPGTSGGQQADQHAMIA